VAETSSVGRALGLLGGYGCYGTGLASVEEVLRVVDRPDPAAPSAATGRAGDAPDGGSAQPVPAPHGPGTIRSMVSARGSAQALDLRPGAIASAARRPPRMTRP
jgi:hypothetical protein